MNNNNRKGHWEFDQEGNATFVEEPEETHSYSYSYSFSKNTSRSGGKKSSDDGWHWILIVLGFAVFWPAGLVLLFLQLSGKWPGSQKVERELRRVATAAQRVVNQESSRRKTNYVTPEEVRTGSWQAERTGGKPPKKKPPQKQKKEDPGAPYGLGHGRTFRLVGSLVAAAFGFGFLATLVDEIRFFYSWNWLVGETLPLLAMCLVGVTLIGVEASRKRKLRRFEKYLSMIGSRTVVPLATLAKAMGTGEKAVERDMEEMLERGFWDSGYVDAARRALVLGESLEDEPEPEPQEESEDTAKATLRHIRQVNDAIANPELSRKIDRIEELTAKIFQLVRERPEKAGELRSFMNYYLPQTLKILENYSKLEAQGIEGENISAAKARIEGMMDKLVDGYETQLDKLFANDVLDISADLKVMESMLEKDGLTADSELKF